MALASGHNSLLSCNGSAALSSEREHFDLPRGLLHLMCFHLHVYPRWHKLHKAFENFSDNEDF